MSVRLFVVPYSASHRTKHNSAQTTRAQARTEGLPACPILVFVLLPAQAGSTPALSAHSWLNKHVSYLKSFHTDFQDTFPFIQTLNVFKLKCTNLTFILHFILLHFNYRTNLFLYTVIRYIYKFSYPYHIFIHINEKILKEIKRWLLWDITQNVLLWCQRSEPGLIKQYKHTEENL